MSGIGAISTQVLAEFFLEAARGVRDHRFSFWDAQIWTTARLNQLPLVFSEDFNPGQVTEGVRFVDPFAADFQLEEWVPGETR